MSDYPRMIFRAGDMLPEHGVDYRIVSDAVEEADALAEGWRLELVVDEPTAAPEAPRRGRPRKA